MGHSTLHKTDPDPITVLSVILSFLFLLSSPLWLPNRAFDVGEAAEKMTCSPHESEARNGQAPRPSLGVDNSQGTEVFDIHVDTQYASTNCNERMDDAAEEFRDGFRRKPWEHCRDAPNTFLSIRVSKRAEFLRELGKSDKTRQKRVQHEIDRIRQTSVNFSSYPNKKKLMDDLHQSRQSGRKKLSRRGMSTRRRRERRPSAIRDRSAGSGTCACSNA